MLSVDFCDLFKKFRKFLPVFSRKCHASVLADAGPAKHRAKVLSDAGPAKHRAKVLADAGPAKHRAVILVDAAVCLPVFILAMASMLGILEEIKAEDELYASLAKKASEASYTYVATTTLEDISGIDAYYSSDYSASDIQYLTVSGTAKDGVEKTLYFRPFCGESQQDKESFETVYVYSRRGECFHTKYCSTLDNNKNYTTMTRQEAEDCGYIPCSLCCPGGTDYFKSGE